MEFSEHTDEVLLGDRRFLSVPHRVLDPAEMKTHSKTQRIGIYQGDSAFRDFAAQNKLAAKRADEDVGTDFFCVPETDADTAGYSSVTGHVVGNLSFFTYLKIRCLF